jgi:hypothetical protein
MRNEKIPCRFFRIAFLVFGRSSGAWGVQKHQKDTCRKKRQNSQKRALDATVFLQTAVLRLKPWKLFQKENRPIPPTPPNYPVCRPASPNRPMPPAPPNYPTRCPASPNLFARPSWNGLTVLLLEMRLF